MAESAVITRFSQKYPYIPIDDLETIIYQYYYFVRRCAWNELEVILRRFNNHFRYGIMSELDTTDEPKRLDVLRDEKTLDSVLPTFPTDVCRIILSYGVLSSEEIITAILSVVSVDFPAARLRIEKIVYYDAQIELNIIDNFDSRVLSCIKLTMNSAAISIDPTRLISNVDFTKGYIKNQAIRAITYIASDKDLISTWVQIVLMWRSWTM